MWSTDIEASLDNYCSSYSSSFDVSSMPIVRAVSVVRWRVGNHSWLGHGRAGSARALSLGCPYRQRQRRSGSARRTVHWTCAGTWSTATSTERSWTNCWSWPGCWTRSLPTGSRSVATETVTSSGSISSCRLPAEPVHIPRRSQTVSP